MKIKLFASVLSIMTFSNTISPIISNSEASTENSYEVNVNVSVNSYRKSISPYIYEINTMQINQAYN